MNGLQIPVIEILGRDVWETECFAEGDLSNQMW
jgi:hypothetical protein